ncbi:FG-GAP repeat protein (macronuclear) [Tetrahymena thermophila SB210]|uniref:FG-GAP repeat protein n=1 Tax=Tetrahymena thermophila (strain SB210) TaxID=312017 RepID=I7MAS7_TETTS|nr:FG-GAP repeat protein [Tetrahymena thermophila SB210]EAS06005.2 FG-GAP repeat protein [Tetrahymena thermophila SB210]|eukprot:XP_001026250.2 FG-GAP repeat protein [Tetrahymena thermophila SB210]
MDNDFLKISNNSEQSNARTKFCLQDFVQEKMQYPQQYSQNENFQVSEGKVDNQKEYLINRQLKNSNSYSIHTQSSLQTKDCTTPLLKSDYDFEQSRIFLKDCQLLDSSPLLIQKDKFSLSHQNFSNKQAFEPHKEETYITFKSQDRNQSSDNFSKNNQQKVVVNDFLFQRDTIIGQGADLKLKKYHSHQTIKKPNFNFIDNMLNTNQKNTEEDTNLQILIQYQNQIKQLQQDSNLERKKYQNEVNDLLKVNKDLQRKISLQNQEYQFYPQKQNDSNNFSFKQYDVFASKQHENFSFANLNKQGDNSLPSNIDELKKIVFDLKFENKELQLKQEALNQELNQNKYQFENILANKVTQFEKQKKILKNKCKQILHQMSGMKNELILLKDKTLELKDNNQNQLIFIDQQAFKHFYANFQQSQNINQQYQYTTIQQLNQKLEENEKIFEQYKKESARQIDEKNIQIQELLQKIEQLELQQSNSKVYQKIQKNNKLNENANYNDQSTVNDSTNLQSQLTQSIRIESPKNFICEIEEKHKQEEQIERQSNFIKQLKQGRRTEEQMRSIQIENMQKYLNLEQKYSKMNSYYSDRLQQSDSQVLFKEQRILQKDIQIKEKEQQISDYQDFLQIKEEKQRVNKYKQLQIQKSLEDFLNDKSNQHLEYKRASSQELLRLKKELSQVNFEKRKQSDIIQELLQIKDNQKKEIQTLKRESMNVSSNSSINRQFSLQNNNLNTNSSDIIRENFAKSDSKTTPLSSSARVNGKKQTELCDIMKQIGSYSSQQQNKNKVNQNNHYVVISDSNSKNQDYFIDKQLKSLSQKNFKKSSEEAMQQLKPKKLTFFDHKDNNLSKMINELDWSKFLQSQSNQFQSRSMKQQMCGIQTDNNDTSQKSKQKIENKN